VVTDIVVVLVIIAFVVWGGFRGFMRTVLGFVTTTIAVIISIFASRPVLQLINSITNNTIERDGQIALHIMVAVGVFIFIKIMVMILKYKIGRIKERNGTVNKVDRLLGMLLGLVKFFVFACVIATFIMVLGSIFSGLHNFLFGSSTVASWIYDLALEIVHPLINTVSSAIISIARG